MLLFWGILEPLGATNSICAIRFSAAVCVEKLRIFPSGAQPFKAKEDIVATTEPESFYLDVYFNAQPIGSDSKGKAKPSNTLVSTSVAYQGGQVDVHVDTEREDFATRIMIIRGHFQKLSLAVYGSTLPESSSTLPAYQPKPLRQLPPISVPSSLNVASKMDPSELARGLLTLIPDAPDLRLITRLMFCLKPSNEDWEERGFPYLFSDLEKDLDELNLDKAVEMTARPVSDNIEEDVLKYFAERLSDSVIDYNDDDAYLLAKLLSQCAPQHPRLIQYITDNIDLSQMYDTTANLDRPTLLYLLDAASSPEVSNQLRNEQTLKAISSISESAAYDDGARRAATRLLERINGWDILEDALSNTQASFEQAISMIREVAMEENSFGIWLENMISNPEITERLLDNPVPGIGATRFPSLWSTEEIASHDEFIALVRAIVGVAAVIAVYAWSDSVPVYACRERALGVLRLWQTIDGYREIVNHLLLMRQMTYRLECMLPVDDDLPSQGGIDAEHILKALSAQPGSYLRADFVKVMNNLQTPLNYITNDEILNLKQASGIAADGISGAIGTIIKETDAAYTSQSRLELRIATAILMATLEKQVNGEQQIMEGTWAEGCNGLSNFLVDHLARNTSELSAPFSLNIPPRKSDAELDSLFSTCFDLLRLIVRLIRIYPLTHRHLSSLTSTIVDIFVCIDSADTTYSQESSVCALARLGRQSCINAINSLILPSEPERSLEGGAPVVLKALLTRSREQRDHDAAHHTTQAFWLLERALPTADAWTDLRNRQDWIRRNLPPALPELRRFYGSLEGNNKLHLIKRLKDLDGGCIGVAEWLLLAEQQSLSQSISLLHSPVVAGVRNYTLWQANVSFSVLSLLTKEASDTREWALDALLKDDEQLEILESNAIALLKTVICFESAEEFFVDMVSARCSTLEKRIRSLSLGILCRSAKCHRFDVLEPVLRILHESKESLLEESIAQELGELLEEIGRLVGGEDEESLHDHAETIFHILEELTPLDSSKKVLALRGVTEGSLNNIIAWATRVLGIDQSTKMEAMKSRWTISGIPRPTPEFIATSYLPEMPLDEWEDLLKPPAPVPSTPTRRSPAQSAEMVGLITVSPPNALLRSPEVKGLTKTYQNNDFRQLRQTSASRQNTSRLPSMHVDDFEQNSSAGSLPVNLSSSPPAPPNFAATTVPQRSVPLDLSLPMNPMLYHNPPH